MTTKPPQKRNTLSLVRNVLEDLRNDLVDLEAMNNAARNAVAGMPYIPRPSRRPETRAPGAMTGAAPETLLGDQARERANERARDVEIRLNFGRLQSMVFAAAERAGRIIESWDAAIERIVEAEYGDDPDDDPDDDDDDNGGGGRGGPAGNGQPGDPGILTAPAQPLSPPFPPLA